MLYSYRFFLISIFLSFSQVHADPNFVGVKHLKFNTLEGEIQYSLFYPSQDKTAPSKLSDSRPFNELMENYYTDVFSVVVKANPDYNIEHTIRVIKEAYNKANLELFHSSKMIEAKLPLIIFSTGTGAFKEDYFYLLENIAKKGAVVAIFEVPAVEIGIDKPIYDPIIKEWKIVSNSAPVNFKEDGDFRAFLSLKLLDHLKALFKPYIDPTKTVLTGHSIGGHGSFIASNSEKVIKHYVNLDGSFNRAPDIPNFTNIHAPMTLIVTNEDSEVVKSILTNNHYFYPQNIDNLLNFKLQVPFQSGVNHFSFTNQLAWMEYSPQGQGFTPAFSDITGEVVKAKTFYRKIADLLYSLAVN